MGAPPGGTVGTSQTKCRALTEPLSRQRCDLLIVGWEWNTLLKGLLCVLAVGIVSQSLAFAALRGRVKRGG